MQQAGFETILVAMNDKYNCCICGNSCDTPAKVAKVHSNVRDFASETFNLWKCPSCGSIHSQDQVDLDYYYSKYPFFGQKLDWAVKSSYRGLLRRLKRAGLSEDAKILDFGCGSGLLVKYLRSQGYNAAGYDKFNDQFNLPDLLFERFDCVIAQDVIEHAPKPQTVLDQLGALAKPGGLIFIGTPNAAGINLDKPEKFIHPLHQPYHRHIFSIDALKKCAANQNWDLVKYYSTPYTNMPGLSLPFLHHYMRAGDGTLNVLFDRKISPTFWLNPLTYFLLITGYFLCDDADIVAIFRKQISAEE